MAVGADAARAGTLAELPWVTPVELLVTHLAFRSNFEMTKAQVYGFPLHSILQVCIFYKEYYAVSLLPLSHEITD